MAKRKKFGGDTARRFTDSGYSGGGASRTNKTLKAWRALKLSPKSDIDANLATLRNRAADLSINSSIGAAAIQTSATNVVGTGLSLFPRIKHRMLGLTPKEAREWTNRVKHEFSFWSNSLNCDLYRRNNFFDLQHIAYVSYLTDGDSFALFRRKQPTRNNPYSLKLQIIEGNRVSNPYTGNITGDVSPWNVEMRGENGNRIISGVEIDGDGAIVAYWVSNRVPGDVLGTDGVTEWTRVRAFGGETGTRNILQICHDVRPEQFRGVPYLAPVIESLKQISRYTSAELASAIVKSFFALFFTQPTSAFEMGQILPQDANEPVVDMSEYVLGSGTVSSLPRGVDVKSVDASNAQSTFGAFMQELVTHAGAALGIPYEVLMKSFKSSYSASRAAILQAAEEFRQRRIWFARDFCQPVYETWLAEAVAVGRIDAPGFFADPLIRQAWSNAEWFGAGMPSIDPVKEMAGSLARVQQGLSTNQREAAEITGSDYEENLEVLAYERELAKDILPPIEQAAISANDFDFDDDEDNDDENDAKRRQKRAVL